MKANEENNVLKDILKHINERKGVYGWVLYFALLPVFLLFKGPLRGVPVIGILFMTVQISLIHLILISPIPLFLFHTYMFVFRGGHKKQALKRKARALLKDVGHISEIEDLAEVVEAIVQAL
jgi:hypothetical protein